MKYAPLISTLLALLILAGCTEPDPLLEPELRTQRVCDEGVGEFDVFVERQISAIGPVGNELAASHDALWVVESGSNTVSRYDREAQQLESYFVDVGNERNPYAIDLDEESRELWIANYATQTVSIADMDTGEIKEEIEDDSFLNPSAVVLTDGYAYVGNINFISIAEGYGPGSVSIIERAGRNVVGEIETAFKNPQFMSVEVIDGVETLLVSSGGAFERIDGAIQITSEGGLEIFDIGLAPEDPDRESFALGQLNAQSIERSVGAPGQALLTPDGESLYFASGTAPVLFVFDLLERRWIHDASSPIKLYETDGDATHKAAIDSEGLLWITSFNEDALYLFDTHCDEKIAPPIDVGRVTDMLEGPQSILVAEDEMVREGYILLTISNALGRVHLVPVSEIPGDL